MASVIDSDIMVGKESTYGTAATLTRSYEGHADSWKKKTDFLQSTGFRKSMQAARSDHRVAVNMGGEGELEIDVLTKGFGLILQSMLGSVAGPTQVGATSAYTTTAATTTADPNDSWTVQVQRVDVGGTARSYTHKGCVMTGWEFTQDVSGLLVAKINFDFQDVDTVTAAGTPSHSDAPPFNWTQAVISINSVATDATKFSLKGELGLNTERRFLRGSALKKQPIRQTLPSFSGAIEVEFSDNTLYALYDAGTTFPITATWTGATIGGGESYKFTITLPCCQFDEGSPEAQYDGLPIQSLPFTVLDNGTDAVVTIAYESTDTTL